MTFVPGNASVGDLIADMRQGNRQAAGELMEVLYPELRRLAAAKMKRERVNHTWQPTALVKELYLELIKARRLDNRERGNQDEKDAFFGLAAHMMMRLLIHHARPLSKRVSKVSLEDETPLPRMAATNLQNLDTLLASLESVDPQLRLVVEMKVFEGLSVDEMAARLQCSGSTVKRLWHFARQWLTAELRGVPAANEK